MSANSSKKNQAMLNRAKTDPVYFYKKFVRIKTKQGLKKPILRYWQLKFLKQMRTQ